MTCGQLSWDGARDDCLSGKMCQGGVSQSRRLGVAHVGKDDLKVVLILLDDREGCMLVR